MSDSVEKLFHTTNVKDFVALFKEIQENYESPRAFLNETVAYLPVRLYEHYYRDNVPHSFFGLMAASQLNADLVPEENRWRPYVQQCWFATQEQKRTPLEITSNESHKSGEADGRWQEFEKAARNGNFQEAIQWAGGFLDNDEDRDFFRQRSLSYAMGDTLLGGHKFLYLSQAWQLSQALDWSHTAQILCPALHFLVVAPREQSLSSRIGEYLSGNPLSSLFQNTGEISAEDYQQLEASLLFGARQEALGALESLASSGSSWESARQALLLSSAQALSNAQTGEWMWPMRAFHFCYALDQLQTPEDRTRGLLLGAELLHCASARSRESEQNRELAQVVGHLNPTDPMGELRGLVSHTDPYASATAVYSILEMKDREADLFQTLVSLAVKNDGQVGGGHDLLFLVETCDCYDSIKLAGKNHLPVTASFLLGRMRKNYQLAGEYK